MSVFATGMTVLRGCMEPIDVIRASMLPEFVATARCSVLDKLPEMRPLHREIVPPLPVPNSSPTDPLVGLTKYGWPHFS